MIDVVCGIIYKKDRILLCRKKAEKSIGGLWEFPGGKIEPNESPKNALTRELLEELDMDVDILNSLYTITHEYENFSIRLTAYKCNFKKASFELTDHDKYEWLKLDQLENKNLAPADILILKKLKNTEF